MFLLYERNKKSWKNIKTCKKYNINIINTSEIINTSKYNLCNVDCGNLENLRKHMSLYHNNLCDDCGIFLHQIGNSMRTKK